MNGLSLEFLGWHPAAALAAAAACGWLVLRLRRSEAVTLALRLRLVLGLLRLSALGLLATALAEPALAWNDTRSEAPAVAMVIDRSGSMGLADPGLNPSARLAEAAALGLYDDANRPDAAARAARLLRRAGTTGDRTLAGPARELAAELAGHPALSAGLVRQAEALATGDALRLREAADLAALAQRIQAESDAALVAAAAPEGPLGTALTRVAALPRRERALILAERIAERLPQAAIDWFVLDQRLVPVPGAAGARAALTGTDATDLGEGMAFLARGWAGRGHPAACVLLSDGRRTAGADPEPAARALAARGVRLLAVAVGDPTPSVDVAVAALDAPGEAVAGEHIRLAATVRVPPGAGAWELAWLRDGSEVQRDAVVPDTHWQVIASTFPSGEAGVALWEARLSPAAGSGSGNGWLREVWTGLPKASLDTLRADPRWPDHPDERAVVAAAMVVDQRTGRGDRLRAWLLPPRDGSYELWLSSDDAGELLLAEDGDPAHAHLVARVPDWTRPEEWDKSATQHAKPVRLRVDRPAYLEGQVANVFGPSHLAVGWTRPDGTIERPLPLSVLVPWSAAGPPTPGGTRREATTANNSAARAVAVASAPPRILALDTTPRWELRHAIAALESGLLAQVERRFRVTLGPGAPLVPGQAALNDVDMLLLGDLPPAELGADEQARIAAFVARRGGFVAVVSGPRSMPSAYGLGPLAAMLPVRAGGPEDLPEPDVGAAAGPAMGRVLPDLDPSWDLLPALPWWIRGAVPRPGADVVMQARDRATSPLIVCSEYGAGRIAWLGSDALWRWRGQGDGSLHATLWLRLARWGLGARLSGRDRRLQAALDRNVAVPGQTVSLRLRALDHDGTPINLPPVVLEAIGIDGRPVPGSRRDLALLPITDQPGTWSVSVNSTARPLPDGRWRLLASLGAGIDEARELLVRTDPGREVLEPSLDRASLDRLAAATGGEAVGMAEVDAAVEALAASLSPRTVQVRHRLTIWDGPWWLLLLGGVLVAEWLWRRKAGLP